MVLSWSCCSSIRLTPRVLMNPATASGAGSFMSASSESCTGSGCLLTRDMYAVRVAALSVLAQSLIE